MQDSFGPDPFPFLGMKEKELLKILADLDGLSEEEEIKSLIHVRARILGRVQGLLGQAPPLPERLRTPGTEPSELRVSNVQFENVSPPPEQGEKNHPDTSRE